ncbi:MAG: hypothetical protein WAZ12_00085 [Candidatus Absconditicoccaceae bacterium]
MIYTLSKKILIGLFFLSLLSISFAQDTENDFSIIPENKTGSQNIGNIVNQVGASGGKVMENYKDQAYGKKDPITGERPGTSDLSLGDQLASGIMTRDTLLDYVTYIVRFLLQLGLLIGAVVMIYIGYKKITQFRDFKGGDIKYVIMGIAVLGFAYVIVKMLVNMFIK